MKTLGDLAFEYFASKSGLTGNNSLTDHMYKFFAGTGTLADAERDYLSTQYPLATDMSLTGLRRLHYLSNTTGTTGKNTTAELEHAFYEQELAGP